MPEVLTEEEVEVFNLLVLIASTLNSDKIEDESVRISFTKVNGEYS